MAVDFTFQTRRGKYSGSGSLGGTVRVAGVSQPNFVVWLMQGGNVVETTKSDSLGQYLFENLQTDLKYDVIVHDPTGLWESKISTRRTPE